MDLADQQRSQAEAGLPEENHPKALHYDSP